MTDLTEKIVSGADASSAAVAAAESSSCWRTRDAAHHLLRQRLPLSPSSKDGVMPLSSAWDVDTCMARLRRDKAAVVRTAFDAAASAVLKALHRQEQQEGPPAPSAANLDQGSSVPLVKQWQQWQTLREQSLMEVTQTKSRAKPASSKSAVAPATGKADKVTSSPHKKSKKTTATSNKSPKTITHIPSSSKTTGSSSKTAISTPGAITSAATGVALESRSLVSRAVLCTAASIAFNKLTPVHPGHEVDVTNVPQNPSRQQDESSTMTKTTNNTGSPNATTTAPNTVNMGAVLLQAQTLGQRTASLVKNAVHLTDQRYRYRQDNARYLRQQKSQFLALPNPFALENHTKKKKQEEQEKIKLDDDEDDVVEATVDFPPPPTPSRLSLTDAWQSSCLPRLQSVLRQGAGHAIYHDVEWSSRHGRIADLLRHQNHKFGPHLIVTTQPQVQAFAQEFQSVDKHIRLVRPAEDETISEAPLRVLPYVGSKAQRLKLREHFSSANGLPDSPFHVIVTSYSVLLQDYVQLCQLPYQVALLDDGFGWMVVAQSDSNGLFGTLWDSGVWSKSDEHVGLAGTREWDFLSQTPAVKDACIGLTARHRILTASRLSLTPSDVRFHSSLVSGMVNFLLPHFTDVVREEWDRSKIVNDRESMDHMETLVARSIVVHYPADAGHIDMFQLAKDALAGAFPSSKLATGPLVPEVMSEDDLVSEGKISQSRRYALPWLGPASHSWLLYELGKPPLRPILDTMKKSSSFGYLCEEIVTASSTTSAGAAGTVAGSLAYRLGVRCGRKFGSEQGLRQHMAAMHAPPGTWLCRTCAVDCGTSQARTHHERSCGQPASGVTDPTSGATPTVGQGVRSSGGRQQAGPSGAAGKKPKSPASKNRNGTADKDEDGSVRVPGYRGVWIDTSGKHFVKVDNKRLETDEGSTWLFDTIEEAAQQFDKEIVSRGKEDSAELNFRADGSRIVYEDHVSATGGRGLEMLGGGSSVVPALSIINIKDLPKDVKPLLRDPRQTSRTGGNSKRHVYAYRGVCRQTRKGADRWQSQISFGGTNHYLGTFDSEWDAAAIYAWAHLILYGKEATDKAQKEGEEAAAAYEQEKKDIAAGKIVAPPPKQAAKKKKKTPKKMDGQEAAAGAEASRAAGTMEGGQSKKKATKPKKKRLAKESPASEKKPRLDAKAIFRADDMAPLFSKAVQKIPTLTIRNEFERVADETLIRSVSARLKAAGAIRSSVVAADLATPVEQELRPCMPISSSSFDSVSGGAVLLGLSSVLFGWDVEAFLSSIDIDLDEQSDMASLSLGEEYDPSGHNESFRSAVHGSVCIIGRVSRTLEEAFEALGMGSVPIGSTVGNVDCNIGGIAESCSESAATIQYCPSGGSDFQFCANNDEDVVTLNGQRINAAMGSFPLFHEDVCTIGARVFVFLLSTAT